MKKLLTPILVLTMLFACFNEATAQSFSHSVGAGSYLGGRAAAPSIDYYPRLNFEVSRESSLSIGAPISLGGYLYVNSREGSSIGYVLNVPLVASLNFGLLAHDDANSNFGGFLGAGLGMSRLGSTDAWGFFDRNNAFGVQTEAGFRYLWRGEHPITIRLSYLMNTVENNGDVFGISAVYGISL